MGKTYCGIRDAILTDIARGNQEKNAKEPLLVVALYFGTLSEGLLMRFQLFDIVGHLRGRE